MNIYPAIDLKSGACVRLTQGCYDKLTMYPIDPINLAKQFAEEGANILHVVDLDGAKQGESVNWELIKKISKSAPLKIQTGGGIRTKVQIQERLADNIARVIIGSVAISKPSEVVQWIEEFGSEQIVLAFDVRLDDDNIPRLASHAWQMQTDNSLWDFLDYYQNHGVKHILCTDIKCDGLLQGPNFALYQSCIERYPNLAFQASGGVGSLDDLQNLTRVKPDGVIIGKALYENKFSLSEAIEKVKAC